MRPQDHPHHVRLPAATFVGGLILLTTGTLAACSPSPVPAGPGADLRNFTGAHTRIVWVRGDGTDPSAEGDDLVLMGLDTADGKGHRAILADRRSFVKPMLTPRGDRLVFSSRPHGDGPEVFLVPWDGSGVRRLAKGFALAVWEDPADGREWVYVGTDNTLYDFATVSRFPLDDPASPQLVWNQTMVSSDTFQVSADGRLAAGLFPWPHAGIAELPNRSWRKVGEGCWTALASARGALFWYFDGAHRNLTLVDVRTNKRWTVPINRAPGFDNPEVYHPRWTNHPRFLAITGPYNRGGDNQVRTGGPQTEVWLGRFSEDFMTVEAWLRVTDDEAADYFPDVWIDREGSSYPTSPRGPVGPVITAAAANPAAGAERISRLVVEGRLTHAGPIPAPPSILPYRHALVVNQYEIVDVIEGTYASREIRVAHWAIRDQRVLEEASKTPGTVYRLTIERYDAHPELEGERLITDLGISEQPLYYEVATY